MKIVGQKVLVKMHNTEEKTEGGIIIPVDKRRRDMGVIIAVGSKVDAFEVGQVISKYRNVQGISVDFEGTEHLILQTSLKRCQIEFIHID